ncbi:hypothetical protein BGX27_000650 [Mortierella sp. AM989]|nr:hypothetical protein BGX27_000650 [Mortierella sp. AM989]
MHRLFTAGRPPAGMNKPLPEPLVDPDEGKTPIGELIIVPIEGRDLPNRERFGKQDPFVLFKLGNVSKRTTTDIRGGQRPRWKDDQISIYMYASDAKDAKSLYVTCLDEDQKKNDLIGDCVINLAKVLEQGEQDDWFELSYKGREAGTLLLQLTYFSHDPKHPTYREKRPKAANGSGGGAPLRRPINKKTSDEKPDDDDEERVDEGPVYKPPVVPEPPTPQVPATPQVPMVAAAVGYPYGTLPAGARPVSPSGVPSHYVGHHTQVSPTANPYATPAMPPANPYGTPAVTPANPYGTVNAGYPGYPAAGGPYPDPSLAADPSKRLSFTGQPPVQPGGFLPGYPPVGGSPAYPQATVPGAHPGVGGFPPQVGAGGIYPPTPNPIANSPYPLANPLPIVGAGGPPAGYPFAASGAFPANSNNNNNGGYPTAFPGNSNNNTGPYNNNGGINNHSNGNLNNFNNNNNNSNNNFSNNNNNFNNGGNNNFNGGNNNNNFNNNGNNPNNNNGANNFNNNNGNNFNGNNFNNNGGNSFNNNINNNGGNNFNNNNNTNNNRNSFNNNSNTNNNFNNGHNQSYNSGNNNNGGGGGGYGVKKTNTIVPTPIPVTPVVQPRPGPMYGPDDF